MNLLHGEGSKVLGPFLVAFLDIIQRVIMEVKQPGDKVVLIWNAGATC